jgi:hypothetical protein
VRNFQETELAWALIEAAKPHLRPREVANAFVVLGAGDTFSVIRQLINFVAAKRIPLRAELIQLCGVWLESYAGHHQYEPLRRQIESVMMTNRVHALTTSV